MKIRFRSSSQGAQTKTLTIKSNDPDEASVNVSLMASVVAGKLGFIDRSKSSHIGTNAIHTNGVQWVDYNGDGKLDLYFCGSTGNGLFKNLGNGTFANVTAMAKAETETTIAWAPPGPMSTTTATPTCLLPTQPDRRFCSRITAACLPRYGWTWGLRC